MLEAKLDQASTLKRLLEGTILSDFFCGFKLNPPDALLQLSKNW
jgi:hypothetical protein